MNPQLAISAIKRFTASDAGVTAVEYGLIATALALSLVPVLAQINGALGAKFAQITAFFTK